MKRALITGISGQDGSYLSEYLLGLGNESITLLAALDADQRASFQEALNQSQAAQKQ